MKITRKELLLGLVGTVVLADGAGKAVNAITDAGGSASAESKSVRWGMVVDSKACANRPGCQDCSRACRLAHNVPQIPDSRQEIKWIWQEPQQKVFPFQQTDYASASAPASGLPVLCNHCASPPCVRVCPTQATWKRQDGIVMMDFHRCIGCRYCMAACPYGARSFNFVNPRPYLAQTNPDYPTRTQGVVEKCSFCEERLAEGKQPACVEACTDKALLFGDLNDENSVVRKALRERMAVRRQPELGTGPAVFYLV